MHQSPVLNVPIFMSQGIKYLEVGRYAEAEEEFQKVLGIDPENDVAHYNLACTYSLWGKFGPALEHLRLSIEYGFTDFDHIGRDPDLDPLRKDPRFQPLIEEMKAKFGEKK